MTINQPPDKESGLEFDNFDGLGGARVATKFNLELFRDGVFGGIAKLPALQDQYTKRLTPEEATKQYGIPGRFKFEHNTNEGFAKKRKEQELWKERQEIALEQIERQYDNPVIGAATTFGAAAVDVDNIATMALAPAILTGKGVYAVGKAVFGRKTMQAALKHKIASRIAAGATVSLAEGFVGQATSQPFIFASKSASQEDYTIMDAAVNTLLGTVASTTMGTGVSVFKARKHIFNKAARNIESGRVSPEAHSFTSVKALHDVMQVGEATGIDEALTFFNTIQRSDPDSLSLRQATLKSKFQVIDDLEVGDLLTDRHSKLKSASSKEIIEAINEVRSSELFTRSLDGLDRTTKRSAIAERKKVFSDTLRGKIYQLGISEPQILLKNIEDRFTKLDEQAPVRENFSSNNKYNKALRQHERLVKKLKEDTGAEVSKLTKQVETNRLQGLLDTLEPGDVRTLGREDLFKRLTAIAEEIENNPRFKDVDIDSDLANSNLSMQEKALIEQLRELRKGTGLTDFEIKGILDGDPAIFDEALDTLEYQKQYTAKTNKEAINNFKNTLDPQKILDERREVYAKEIEVNNVSKPKLNTDSEIIKEIENTRNSLKNLGIEDAKVEKILKEIDEEAKLVDNYAAAVETGLDCILGAII